MKRAEDYALLILNGTPRDYESVLSIVREIQANSINHAAEIVNKVPKTDSTNPSIYRNRIYAWIKQLASNVEQANKLDKA